MAYADDPQKVVDVTAWRIRAVGLPDGDEPVDRWLDETGWSDSPLPDAEHLPGRFALPGLVDAHSHVSFGVGMSGPLLLGPAGAEESRDRAARDGVSVLRDAGGDPEVVLRLTQQPGRPLVVAAGRHLAPYDRYFAEVHAPVEPERLIEVALAEVAAGARWVKLVADFPSYTAMQADPGAPALSTYDLELVREVVSAAHAHGARVAAHVTTELVTELVATGIDSIEHGSMLDPATVDEMGRRGTAWTPTLCATLSLPPEAPVERQRRVAERKELMSELLPRAVRAGVPVLTGSDVVGSIPREVALLVECGLDATTALRCATTTGTGYLGVEGTSSVVTYDDDPRADPSVLTRPAAVVIWGARVA